MPQELSVLLAKRRTIAPNRQQAKPRPEKVPVNHDASVPRLWDALVATKPGSVEAEQILEAWRA